MNIPLLVFGIAVIATMIWLLGRFVSFSKFSLPSNLKGGSNSLKNHNQMALAEGVENIDGFELGPVTPVNSDNSDYHPSVATKYGNKSDFDEVTRRSEASNPDPEADYAEEFEILNERSEQDWQQNGELDWNLGTESDSSWQPEIEPNWQGHFDENLPLEGEQVPEQEFLQELQAESEQDLQTESEQDWQQESEQNLELPSEPAMQGTPEKQRDDLHVADPTSPNEKAPEKKSSPMAKIYEFADSFNFAKKSNVSNIRRNRTPMLKPVSIHSEAVKFPKPGSQEVAAVADLALEEDFSSQTEINLTLEVPDYLENVNREIDVIGWLPGGEESIQSHRVFKIYEKLDVKLKSPLLFQGFDVAEERWCDLGDGSVKVNISDIVLSIPLSYRGEPVSEREWWLFSTMVEDVASALSRIHCITETTDTVFDHARDINNKFLELDLQVALLLKSDDTGCISRQAMSYMAREFQLQVQQKLPIYDMIASSEGEEGVLFSVIPFSESTHALALELDLDPESKTVVVLGNLSACVSPRETFDKMFDLSQNIADRLSLKLVDLNDQDISFNSIRYIRSIIDRIVDEMNEFGIEPGSDVSARMFGRHHYLQELVGIQEE